MNISIAIDIMVRDEYYYIIVVSIHYFTRIQFMVTSPVPLRCSLLILWRFYYGK